MKKSTKKKVRDIRSALVMVIVMVAMLSTASYAWFSLTDSPTVSNMQMTAASSSGGLEVSNEAEDGFHAAINVKNDETNPIKTLKPVTPDDTTLGAFKEGVYTGNTVTGLSTVTNVEDYVAKYTYYLKSTATPSETEQIDIGIIMGDSTQSASTSLTVDERSWTPAVAGSMVRRTSDAEGASEVAAWAVRVGFVATAMKDNAVLTPKMIIWDPNTEKTTSDATNVNGLSFATNSSGVDNNLGEREDICSETTGKITTGGTDLTSNKMFSMYKGTTTKIDMYVWLEGTDELCVDQIQADDIEAQVQFIVVGGETSSTP